MAEMTGLSGACIINPAICTTGGTFMVWIRVPLDSINSIFSSIIYWRRNRKGHCFDSGFRLVVQRLGGMERKMYVFSKYSLVLACKFHNVFD